MADSDQDCRGWPLLNPAGKQVGTVRDMLVDTDGERVTALVLDSGTQVPAEAVSLDDGRVRLKQADALADRIPSTSRADVIVVPVVEEAVRVDKRVVAGDGVRITARVEQKPVEESVTLRKEKVHVEFRPVNRAAGKAGDPAFAEGSMEIGTLAEEAVVQKEARVVAEVVVSKEVKEHEEVIHENVRRTVVDVKELDAAATKPPRDR